MGVACRGMLVRGGVGCGRLGCGRREEDEDEDEDEEEGARAGRRGEGGRGWKRACERTIRVTAPTPQRPRALRRNPANGRHSIFTCRDADDVTPLGPSNGTDHGSMSVATSSRAPAPTASPTPRLDQPLSPHTH